MNDIVIYLFTRRNGTVFVTELVTKKLFFRCSNILDDYVLVVSHGLRTLYTSCLYSRKNGFVGFLDIDKNFATYAACALYCSNHLSNYSLSY